MVEPDVDRKRSGDGNPSYVSGPELGWRGTGRGRPLQPPPAPATGYSTAASQTFM